MSSLLSAITGQLTKAIVLGALLPAAVFVFLFLVFVAPLLPPSFAVDAPHWFGPEWNALSITFTTLVLAGLLFNLDTPLIRLYEGYPWKESTIGRWRIRAMRREFDAQRRRIGVFYEIGRYVTPEEWQERFSYPSAETERAFAMDFPDDPELVLPTRLGNVLRSFENYPSTQYGMDAIYFWPRLIAVIPERSAAALSDARTTLVFLLTLSFLTAALGLMTAATGLVYLPPRPFTEAVLPAAGFFLASWWLYARSPSAAENWGQLVRGAFDLYRWELLDALGYRPRPRTRNEERALWERITHQIMFVKLDATEPSLDYAAPPADATTVRAEPHGVGVALTRAVEGAGSRGELRVVVEVRNTDAQRRLAKDVVVTESLPSGVVYRWRTARVDGADAPVAGTGPYRFSLGDVRSGASAVLTYTACATHLEGGR